MVSWLVQAEIDGRQLEDYEISSFFVMLSGAANDTTGHAIAHSLLELQRNPDQKAWLLADFEGRIDTAVDELLRWRSPLVHFRRTATEDYELGGKTIKAGDKVVLWYDSGNHDSDVFSDPDRLDLSRKPNRHLSFGGGGVHYCLGQALGKRPATGCAARGLHPAAGHPHRRARGRPVQPSLNHMNKLPATWTPPKV